MQGLIITSYPPDFEITFCIDDEVIKRGEKKVSEVKDFVLKIDLNFHKNEEDSIKKWNITKTIKQNFFPYIH